MELTKQQVRYIQEWAERRGVVETVRLYGSWAKGSARADSDVDLALTVGTGQYVRLPMSGKKELSDALVLKVRLKQYNSPADDSVRRRVQRSTVSEVTARSWSRARSGPGKVVSWLRSPAGSSRSPGCCALTPPSKLKLTRRSNVRFGSKADCRHGTNLCCSAPESGLSAPGAGREMYEYAP